MSRKSVAWGRITNCEREKIVDDENLGRTSTMAAANSLSRGEVSGDDLTSRMFEWISTSEIMHCLTTISLLEPLSTEHNPK